MNAAPAACDALLFASSCYTATSDHAADSRSHARRMGYFCGELHKSESNSASAVYANSRVSQRSAAAIARAQSSGDRTELSIDKS